jgi:hypothetical protein
MYRIWTGTGFACRDSWGKEIHAEAESVYDELRGLAKSAMGSLERDILGMLDKFLKPRSMSPSERLPIWACMMQLILTYRDLYADCQPSRSVPRSLMKAVSVMCDAHFKKQMPEWRGTSERSTPTIWQAKFSDQLDLIFSAREEHCELLDVRSVPSCSLIDPSLVSRVPEQIGSLDCFLKELLIQAPHQNRRKRRRVAA